MEIRHFVAMCTLWTTEKGWGKDLRGIFLWLWRE